MEKRRLIFAKLLLAIILPTILLPAFHHHEEYSEADCTECTGDVPHKHLTGAHGIDFCLVCQMLATPWLSSDEVTCLPFSERSAEGVFTPSSCVINAHHSFHSTRAPPAVSC